MYHELNIEVVPLAEVPANEPDSVMEKPRHVVLIVDDEPVIADTLSTILSRSGYTVLTAYDGLSALELAKVVPPELLITDVVMPGMTGIDLAISLTKFLPDCKVLLFSGHAATRHLLAKASATGNNFEIVTKPIHPSDMLKRITECLRAREVINMPQQFTLRTESPLQHTSK